MKEQSLTGVIVALEDLYSKFNNEIFAGELQKPIITVSPDQTKGAYGWCTTWKAWKEKDSEEDGFYEINLCAEHLTRPFTEVCGTLLHEMVHLYNLQIGVKDCSRNGTYHNTKFKNEALKRKLCVEQTKKYGWSTTKLNDEMEKFIIELKTQDFEIYRSKMEKVTKKSNSNSKKYYCPECGVSVRATKEVRIICMDCGIEMVCDDE